MMEDIIERARRLNLGGHSSRGPVHVASSSRSVTPRSDAGGLSDQETSRGGYVTSGALRSDADSNSIGYSSERTSNSLVAIAHPPQSSNIAHMDPTSIEPDNQVVSPGAQTLASMKEEALPAKGSKRRKSKVPSKPRTTRRRVTRSCKIMKEEFFEGMA